MIEETQCELIASSLTTTPILHPLIFLGLLVHIKKREKRLVTEVATDS